MELCHINCWKWLVAKNREAIFIANIYLPMTTTTSAAAAALRIKENLKLKVAKERTVETIMFGVDKNHFVYLWALACAHFNARIPVAANTNPSIYSVPACTYEFPAIYSKISHIFCEHSIWILVFSTHTITHSIALLLVGSLICIVVKLNYRFVMKILVSM